MKRTRRRRGLGAAVAVVGVLLGLYLLSLMRVEVPDAETALARPVAMDVKRPAKRVYPPDDRAAPATGGERPTDPILRDTAAGPIPEGLGYVAIEFVDLYGEPIVGPLVQPFNCMGFTLVKVLDGKMLGRLYAAEPGLCRFRGVRFDGALRAHSDPEEVMIVDGERASVQLVMPRERTGGIGINFQPTEEGMLVRWVMPGTPAWEAGLTQGDLIVEVDGLPSSLLTNDEFVQVMTGPEGTDIEFVLNFETDTGLTEEAMVLERAFLEG